MLKKKIVRPVKKAIDTFVDVKPKPAPPPPPPPPPVAAKPKANLCECGKESLAGSHQCHACAHRA